MADSIPDTTGPILTSVLKDDCPGNQFWFYKFPKTISFIFDEKADVIGSYSPGDISISDGTTTVKIPSASIVGVTSTTLSFSTEDSIFENSTFDKAVDQNIYTITIKASVGCGSIGVCAT